MIDYSKFSSKEELFSHLHTNKTLLIAQKKSAVKQADSVSYFGIYTQEDKPVASHKGYKGNASELLKSESIQVKSVINTTNILDSHGDVHIDSIWNKTLKDQNLFYLIKEHVFNFDNVISDEVTAYTENMSWKELGFDWQGYTQALIFDSVIHRKNNAQMFERYVNGKVKNHSVGMQYVKLHLAINSDESEYKEEKEVWDKYYNSIVNKSEAAEQGYFWAVTEAKIIEGSAVLRGSNYATPTQSVNEIKNEPSFDTHKDSEPLRALTIFEKIGCKI